MERPDAYHPDEDFIEAERERLLGITGHIEGYLADFRDLLSNDAGHAADFSFETIPDVENLLIGLRANFDKHQALLADAVFYIGESICRTFNGKWDISSDVYGEYADHYGLPVITGHSPYEDFFPFLAMKHFIAKPAPGFFAKLISSQIRP